MDLVSVTTSPAPSHNGRTSGPRRLFSFLSVAWGFVSDVDIESERYVHERQYPLFNCYLQDQQSFLPIHSTVVGHHIKSTTTRENGNLTKRGILVLQPALEPK